MTVKTRLWAGSVLFMLMTAILCAFAIKSLDDVASLVLGIFDRPLVISGEAGGIATAFMQMDRALINVIEADNRSTIAENVGTLQDLTSQVKDSLVVIAERSDDAGRQVVKDVERHVLALEMLTEAIVLSKGGGGGTVSESMLASRKQVAADLGDSIIILVEYALGSGLTFRLDAVEVSKRADRILAIAAACAVLVGAVTSVWLIRSIVGPLNRITGVVRRLADGDTAVVVVDDHRKDEVGAISRAVAVFRTNIIEKQRADARHAEAQERAEEEKRAALQKMAETVERETRQAVENVAGQTSRMADNAAMMAQSAAAVSQNSQNVAAAAAQALANVQTVAAATEQLNASIREIASQIASATTVTGEAVAASSQAERTIVQLTDAVGSIGEVAKLINSIASQTNLLALNATIEAARAGEAGKGFAVVANEVKNLANQTARATGEISTQIAQIRDTTTQAVEAVGNITDAIQRVEAVSAAVGAAVEEQAAATGEIARSVTETSMSAQEVAERITRVSSEAAITGQRAGEISEISTGVAGGVESLQEVLVRVVRTSTGDVNRRRKPRFRVELPAKLIADGQPNPVVVKNLSQGGAMVGGVDTAVTGSMVDVVIDAAANLAIPAKILSCEHGRAHLKFHVEGDQSVDQAVAQLTAGKPLAA